MTRRQRVARKLRGMAGYVRWLRTTHRQAPQMTKKEQDLAAKANACLCELANSLERSPEDV
jgi:hypothetical protein